MPWLPLDESVLRARLAPLDFPFALSKCFPFVATVRSYVGLPRFRLATLDRHQEPMSNWKFIAAFVVGLWVVLLTALAFQTPSFCFLQIVIALPRGNRSRISMTCSNEDWFNLGMGAGMRPPAEC
jgi:hypothetical protein